MTIPAASVSDFESQAHAVHAAGELEAAAAMTLERYGPEVLGFLGACLRETTDAEEVFSIFCEDFWRGLPGFQWRSSMRTWVYALARHAARRHIRNPERRRDRNVPLTQSPEIHRVAEKIRTKTAVFLQTGPRESVRRLREQLNQSEQELLILRIDRGLSWRELAVIMTEEGARIDDEDLNRDAQKLRKRFERVKAKLKNLARQAGLIGHAAK